MLALLVQNQQTLFYGKGDLLVSTVDANHYAEKTLVTCIKNAISITRLFKYPRTRLTTPLATVDEPTSMPS